MKRILIIDDDAMTRLLLSELLKKSGYDTVLCHSGEDGLNTSKTIAFDLVITDYSMPGISGLDVVGELSRSHPGLPVIMLTAFGDVPLTIKSIQIGAFDYIEKPIDAKQLLEVVRNGLANQEIRQSIKKPISFTSRIAIEESAPVGKTPAMKDIFKNIGRISMNRFNVLITGETGTGKEKLARLIHHSGITRDFPMVSINCKELYEDQLEHDIWGYAKGSIPGLKGEKQGKFEKAEEGSVFLDDFTYLPIRLQARLLNVLQERVYFKPGINEPMNLKARIIAASSQPLEDLMNKGRLLKELFYQLKVIHFQLPPLRNRKADIPHLMEQIIKQLGRKLDKQIQGAEAGVLEILMNHEWRGNIRELENTILHAMLLSRGALLEKEHVSLNLPSNVYQSDAKEVLIPLDHMEKEHIKAVLEALSWRKQEAARILNITRPTLNKKIDKFQLKPTR